MKICLRLSILTVVCVVTSSAFTHQAAGQVESPSYLFYSSRRDRQAVEELREMLQQDMKHKFATADTIEEVLKSDARVLIIDMPERSRRPDEKLAERLEKAKVIGIGYGVAQLYGVMGLEINGGACAHTSRVPSAVFLPSKTLSDIKRPTTISPSLASGPDTFAMYIPRGSHLTEVVDVIARWGGDSNYAPIVRQGNHILIGYTAPIAGWSDEYKSRFGDMAAAVHAAPGKEFEAAEWPDTMPGTYEFALARGRSTEAVSAKAMYFKFDEPTRLTLQLTHEGSNNMMMLFSQDKGRLHWSRKDARRGEPLEMTAQITQADIEAVNGGYWRLKITNFDRGSPVSCSVEVSRDKLK